MSIEIRDSIYSDIANQFPDVYKENSDFLIGFIEAYYQHLDSKLDRDLPKLRDIDTTLTAFLIYYRNKHLADLPLAIDPPIDIRFILKHVTNLYTRKGTKESLSLLFKMFFDEDIEIIYPGSNVLRASDSLWGGEAFIEMKTVYDVKDYPIQRGNTIIGDLSQATAFVDGIVFVTFGGALTPIMYLSNQRGTFSAEDSLEVRGADENGVDFIKNVGKMIAGSLSKVTVNKLAREPLQVVGDALELRSRESGVGAKGVVTKVSDEQIGTIDYEIIDGGFGYIDPASISITGPQSEFANEQTVRISNQVVILEGTTVQNIKAGDTLVFPGSTVDYEGVETNDENGRKKPRFSLTGGGVVTEYRHPLVFLKTEKDKNTLFDFVADTYTLVSGPNIVYRNKLYDSFYNAYQTTKSPPDASVSFPVPDLDIMQVITDKYSLGGGVIGNFTGKEKPTATISSVTDHVIVLNEGLAAGNFTEGETVVSPSGTGVATDVGRATVKFVNKQNNSLTLEVFKVGDVLTASNDNDQTTVVSINSSAINEYTITGASAVNFQVGEIITNASGNRAIITARNTATDVLTIEPFVASATVNGTIGRDHVGDLSVGSNVVRLDDIKILSSYIFALNNGFYDGTGDNDDWLDDATANTVAGGAQGTNTPETDLVDRTPTISPVIPQTENTVIPTLGLHQLQNGQSYTIVHPGTNLTASDFAKIGAKKGIVGEDFVFNGSILNQLNSNVIELSGGEVVTSTLARFDALFSPMKQAYALFFNYLARQNILPKITVGTAFQAPTDNNYALYDNYHTSIQDLVPGRKYLVSDFGDSSYQDWINVGFELSTSVTTFDINLQTTYGSVQPGRTYIIKELGGTPDSDWIALGADSTPAVGEQITIPNPKPGSVGGAGKLIDVASINAMGVNNPTMFFTATALPDGYTLAGKGGMCIDYDNVKGTLVDPANSQNVTPGVYNSGGLFVNPELESNAEKRTVDPTILSTAKFLGYVNGDHTNVVNCVSLSELNETSSFELVDIDNAEVVTLSRDRIGDYYREVINPQSPSNDPFADGNYDMLGTAEIENINTLLGDAFGQVTFRLGSISSINENNPGVNYQNDVGVRVVNNLVASLNKKDIILNFQNGGFRLEPGELIEQNIILPTDSIDEVNNLTATQIATFGASEDQSFLNNDYSVSVTNFSIADKEYVARAKFLKQDGRDYYFRPMSFFGFDVDNPIPIRSVDRTITKLVADETSQPMGANAVINGSASYSSGQLDELAITHTGYKYESLSTIDIVNKNPDSPTYNKIVATGDIESFGQGNTRGRWKSKNAFLSEESIKTHDNDYYQEYSYDIKSLIDPAVYKPLVDDVVGVAGTKRFSTPLINSVNSIDSNLSVEITFFDVLEAPLHAQGYVESYASMSGTFTSVNSTGVITGSGFNQNVGDLVRVSGSNTGTGAIPLFDFDLNADAPVTYKISAASAGSITLVTESGGTVLTSSGTLAGLTFEVVTRTDLPTDGEQLRTEQDDNVFGSGYVATSVRQEGSIIE